MKNQIRRVVIIGAGIAGLAAAIRLAKKGFAVRVLEAGSQPGGKMSEIRKEGFRFDTGPSLFTLPHLVEELLEEKLSSKYHKLNLITRYFWEDGTLVNAWAEADKFALEMEHVLGVPASAVHKYLDEARFLYEHTAEMFIFNPVMSLKTLFSAAGLHALKALPRLKAFRSMHSYHEQCFSNPKAVQLFDRFATYNGSDPYKAPATLTMIPHLEHNLGAWFPQGGIYQIAQDLENKAKQLGVSFHHNEAATLIHFRGKKAYTVQTSSNTYETDLVISDVDIARVYDHLIPHKPLPMRYINRPVSSSAIIFYWGIRRTSPMLDVHNILFAEDYRKEFDALANGTLADDLTVYLFISSKIVKSDAPEGCENWFAMINAPYDRGQNWNELRLKARNIILSKVQRILGMDISKGILVEDYADPPLIAIKTGSWRGALYGISSNDPMAAFLRHPNKVSAFSNVYFVGGSVHPGGGIPLCLASAKIVDKLIKK